MARDRSYEMEDDVNRVTLNLVQFPDELILHILSFLDVNDLLNASRISHHFRTLSLDPLLHMHRLHHASHTLSHHLSHRLPLADLMSQRIYITRTSLAARSLGRNLIKIKLNRQLEQRPSVETLVEKGVLPRECYGGNGGMAPRLIQIKRRVERERMKDGLRAWVEGWKGRVSEREKEVVAARGGAAKVEVRWLVRRFALRSRGEDETRGMWGRKVECKEAPARAKVLGLRRFWEKVGREGATAAGGSIGYL